MHESLVDRSDEIIDTRTTERNSSFGQEKISKSIQKSTRCELLKYHDQQAELVLLEFADLNRIDGIHHSPVIRDEPPPLINPETFPDLLRQMYECSDDNVQLERQTITTIPLFDKRELLVALRRKANRRGAVKSSIVVEMIKKLGGAKLHIKVSELYNNNITQGNTDDDWHVAVFNMLPKSGELGNPVNWRPIAVLVILQRTFPRMIYHRLQAILDRHQSDDQFGFRPTCRNDDAFIVLENLIDKRVESNTPLWIAIIACEKHSIECNTDRFL